MPKLFPIKLQVEEIALGVRSGMARGRRPNRDHSTGSISPFRHGVETTSNAPPTKKAHGAGLQTGGESRHPDNSEVKEMIIRCRASF